LIEVKNKLPVIPFRKSEQVKIHVSHDETPVNHVAREVFYRPCAIRDTDFARFSVLVRKRTETVTTA
jgi:hypothetical protein